MSMFKRTRREIPGLNTSSLPDLIFTVLFFFMIVTHMRKVTLKVKYQVPQGTELTRLTKKTAVSYIYIGKPVTGTVQGNTVIQLNDKYATTTDIIDYIAAEKSRMSPEDQQQMTVSIKADRSTKMGIISEVKQALRKSKALKISYSKARRLTRHYIRASKEPVLAVDWIIKGRIPFNEPKTYKYKDDLIVSEERYARFLERKNKDFMDFFLQEIG